jgi:hypothetical protein
MLHIPSSDLFYLGSKRLVAKDFQEKRIKFSDIDLTNFLDYVSEEVMECIQQLKIRGCDANGEVLPTARAIDLIASKSFTICCHDILEQYPDIIRVNQTVNLSFQLVLGMVEFTIE